MLLAVDPGIVRAGFALFGSQRLIKAGTVRVSDEGNVLERAARMARAIKKCVGRTKVELVVEWPQVYQRVAGKTKGDPNSLLPLAAVCGALATSIDDVRIVRPFEWKGQVPKKTRGGANPIKLRVERRLTDSELAAIPPKMAHDGYDAIGIGLWALGRFDGRVLPGASS